MKDTSKEEFENGKWMTVDDVLNNAPIVEKMVDAFVQFMKAEGVDS